MTADSLIVVRSGGDIATGTIQKLRRSGFPVLVLEIDHPLRNRGAVLLPPNTIDESEIVLGITRRVLVVHQQPVEM